MILAKIDTIKNLNKYTFERAYLIDILINCKIHQIFKFDIPVFILLKAMSPNSSETIQSREYLLNDV